MYQYNYYKSTICKSLQNSENNWAILSLLCYIVQLVIFKTLFFLVLMSIKNILYYFSNWNHSEPIHLIISNNIVYPATITILFMQNSKVTLFAWLKQYSIPKFCIRPKKRLNEMCIFKTIFICTYLFPNTKWKLLKFKYIYWLNYCFIIE